MTVGAPDGVTIRVVADDAESARAWAMVLMALLTNATNLRQDFGDDDIRPVNRVPRRR